MSDEYWKWRSSLTSPPSIKSERPTSTLAKAAQKVGVRPGTLRTLLHAEGKIRDEKRKGSPIKVSIDDIARLSEDYTSSLSFAGLAPFLGVGRKIAEKLRDTNEIPVWIPGGKHGAKHRYLYRQVDVENWIDALIGEVPLLSAVPDECLLLADTPKRKHFPIDALINAIRDRRVTVVGRLSDRPKFGGAILQEAETDAAVPSHIKQSMGSQRRGPRGYYRKG